MFLSIFIFPFKAEFLSSNVSFQSQIKEKAILAKKKPPVKIKT